MFKKILLVLLALLVGFLIYVALQPDEYHVERSAVMAATPEAVFEQANDFHKWDAWSPWVKIDPNAKVSFEGPASGTGAKFLWSGNAEVGEGSMTILESKPNELVRIELAFVKPMEGKAITEFNLKPEGDKTRTTWSMHGKNNFVGKVMCSVMSMDKMVGEKYEEGLANMKAIVEGHPLPVFPDAKGVEPRRGPPSATAPIPTGTPNTSP